MFAVDVAVFVANAERGGQGDIGHLIFAENALDQLLAGLNILDALAQVQMLYRAARVQGLQLVLQIHALKNIIGIFDGKLRDQTKIIRTYSL